MKANEIKVGGLYRARISGKLTTVRVDSIDKHEGTRFSKGMPQAAGQVLAAYPATPHARSNFLNKHGAINEPSRSNQRRPHSSRPRHQRGRDTGGIALSVRA